MLVTAFQHEDHNVRIALQRNGRTLLDEQESLREECAYSDEYVRVTLLIHPTRDRIIGYRVRFRKRSHPLPASFTSGTWWCAAFYRHPGRHYPKGRRFRTVYEDDVLIILKYGKRFSDYVIVGRNPPPNERKSDVRFSTIPDVHPIEAP